jgi:hypothetical protein
MTVHGQKVPMREERMSGHGSGKREAQELFEFTLSVAAHKDETVRR